MSHELRFTTHKISKRIALVRRMVHRKRRPIAPFRCVYLPDAQAAPPIDAPCAEWPEIPWDGYWGGPDRNFCLRSRFVVPAGWPDGILALHLPLGVAGDIFTHPEALLYVDNTPIASADRYHHTVYLDAALADGRVHEIALHGWTGLSGWPPDPADRTRLFMRECAVVDIDEAACEFLIRAEVALDVAGQLKDDRPEHHRILNALDAAFLALDTRDPMGEAFYRSVSAARAVLEAGLKNAGTPMDVTLHAIGHAHMDVAYLWPIGQSRRKNARTNSNALRLLERFPDYRFSQSQPQLYAYTERDYPEIFRAIKTRVAEGRWELIGGMWVEPDTNIPGPEALVRQLLLGRRYFAEKFGAVDTPVLWLPDTFGLSWCLPQLAKQAGLRWILSNKASWNQYNRIPASTAWWQGIDGTRILTHFLTTPRAVQHLPFPTNYKSDLSAAEVMGTWTEQRVKAQVADLPICYGYGDGGGGPTDALIRRGRAYKSMPGAPEVRFSTVRAFFEALEASRPDLPVWNDEFYMEGHRGVLTSQGWIKRANRKAEAALHALEFLLSATGGGFDRARLKRAWELLCLHQFHDILPGTSIPEVFADAREAYAEIEDHVATLTQAVGGGGGELVVVNPLPFAMTRVVDVPDKRGAQATTSGTLMLLRDLAPYSITSIPATAEGPQVTIYETDGEVVLENRKVLVRLSRAGDLIRVFDKRAGREVLKQGEIGNRLQVFEDRPISWDAWDIDSFFEDRGESIEGLVRMERVESGPVRAMVEVERHYRSSRLMQRIALHAHSARIDFITEVDWHESHLLLKCAFPVNVLSPRATYDIQWGVIERPTHLNTLWDYAKFEVPAQKWADLSEGDWGVALLNDCKYGYDIRDDVIRLSLIKSATMPDPQADQGKHYFTYALLPHAGDWRGEVQREAYDLNWPALILPVEKAGVVSGSLLWTAAENVVIETVKPAEEGGGCVVRLYESQRRRGPVTLHFGRPIARAARCDLLERVQAELSPEGQRLTLQIHPFEIVSLRVFWA
ncbi:MAG: glycoside hydrolase family 38 C-terminal domain-containing protein [Pseudomonadota bacterium]